MAEQASIPFDAIPILASLSSGDRAVLAPVCELSDFPRGGVIFHEGDPADRIHFLHSGRVKIVKAARDRDLIIEILEKGEPVGAVAVFERRPFPASAIAIDACGVLSIPEGRFFQILESRPEITRRLLAGLTLRLMALNRRLADMTGSVEFRCARLFLTLAERLGKAAPDGSVLLPIPLSRQDIADLLGTTIETAIRIMSRWQKAGVIVTEGKAFRIRDRAALSRIGGA